MLMRSKLSHNKAYILGLLVGGGTIDPDAGLFQIVLPFKKWGTDPKRMSLIAKDILTQISNRFSEEYSFGVIYEIGNSRWVIKPIKPISLQPLIDDLTYLGLPTVGNLLDKCDLGKVKTLFKPVQAEYFISGVFDARGSLTESHRRFVVGAPIVSLEIPGSTRNFNFVIQICSWLTDLGSVTDQILFNHPCQHSSVDPSYKSWRKGFKIRFLVRSFLYKHSFAMFAKSTDVTDLQDRQKTSQQIECKNRKASYVSPVSIHDEIHSPYLQPKVRSKIFYHYHHICAVLGCPHAPYSHIKKLVNRYKELTCVFPLLMKGDFTEIGSRYDSIVSNFFYGNNVARTTLKCHTIYEETFPSDYYIDIESALAFLFAEKLKGKRPGPKDEILHGARNKSVEVHYIENIEYAPILLINLTNCRAVIVSAVKGEANQKALRSVISVEDISVKVKT